MTTGMPAWPPGDPQASSSLGTATGQPRWYRSKLGAVQPFGARLTPGMSLQFTVGPMQIAVENAFGHSLDEMVKVSSGRLRRDGYKFQPMFKTDVAGLGSGAGRIGVTKPKFRKPPGQPMLQLFAMPGQHFFQLTVPEAQADAARSFGPVRIDPAGPPAIVPIVWMPVADWTLFSEQLVLNERGIRLTATITTNPISATSDEYAITSLQGRASQLGNMAVNDGQPDTFLGGQYCVRHTSVLGGGVGGAVRSAYFWAGVVAGYGIQILVVGTQTIIDPERARQLMNYVVLIPPG